MFYIVLCIFYYLCTTLTTGNDCVSPPLMCPNHNITFWLYTRANENTPHKLATLLQFCGSVYRAITAKLSANENTPHQVSVNDSASITDAPWVEKAPIKILIHGYTGHKNFSPNKEIRPAYMKCCDYNIISVDYNPIAREPCYLEAAQNTELVGKCTAQLIDELVKKYKFPLELFHVIGFSLGGQTAGYIGNYITSGKLNRITALDPAMPLFVRKDAQDKIDKDDALYVDVLHTNCLEKGKLEASGHADFYANGCIVQPGCKSNKRQSTSSCSHDRAPAYYAESINTDTGFYASSCYSWIVYMVGWCEVPQPKDEILFGEYAPRDASGLYFFSTNAESPYARGPSNESERANAFFN